MEKFIRIISFLLIGIGSILFISQAFLIYYLYVNQFSFDNYPIAYLSFLLVASFTLGFGVRSKKNLPFLWSTIAFSSYQLYLYLQSLMIMLQNNISMKEIGLIQYLTLFLFIALHAIVFVCSVFVIRKKQFAKKL